MGYYTDFEMETIEFASEKEAVWFAHSLSKDTGLIPKQDGVFVGGYSQDNKWHNWEKDMVTFSLAFPEVLFSISGEGEENDDIWKAKIKNGKSEVVNAVLTFPDFKGNW